MSKRVFQANAALGDLYLGQMKLLKGSLHVAGHPRVRTTRGESLLWLGRDHDGHALHEFHWRCGLEGALRSLGSLESTRNGRCKAVLDLPRPFPGHFGAVSMRKRLRGPRFAALSC